MVSYLAHVKWFTDNPAPVPALGLTEWLVVAGIVILGLCAFWVLDLLTRRFGIISYIDSKLGKYSDIAPYVVRYSTALLLLFNVYEDALLAPNIASDSSSLGPIVSLISVAIAVLLIVGLHLKAAGILLITAYVLTLLTVSQTVDVIDHIEYFGIGLYLILWQNKVYLSRIKKSNLQQFLSPEALLRIGVGLSFVSLAFSEKLIGTANSYQFIATHNWNILSLIGVSDRWFIIVAGAMELFVGLALVLNIAPRVVTLMVLGLMTVTASLLGIDEVFGHLFALSLIAIVWISPYVQTKRKAKRSK